MLFAEFYGVVTHLSGIVDSGWPIVALILDPDWSVVELSGEGEGTSRTTSSTQGTSETQTTETRDTQPGGSEGARSSIPGTSETQTTETRDTQPEASEGTTNTTCSATTLPPADTSPSAIPDNQGAPIDPADWPALWTILKDHVKTTVKSWSDTRWESRINSEQAVRFQTAEVRDALLEVREKATDSMIKTEAQSLAKELQKHWVRFCSGICARDLCVEMNVDTVLKQKRLRKTKRQFSNESPDEPEGDALKKLEISFFNVIVDVSVTSLQERFKLLGDVEDKFGVLVNFPNWPEEELAKKCETLSNTLSHGDHKDVDGRELALELKNFPVLPKAGITKMEILNYLKEKKLEEVFPNMWVALRIAVTLPVTVASAERSFSKLKLLKTYLRSTMSQERLNGLSLMSINQEVSNKIEFDDTINKFAIRKSRRVKF
ncbi:unnamed protein product [Leuciscus chuanchicus]